MTALAALAALMLTAAQPSGTPEATPPAATQPVAPPPSSPAPSGHPPTIDSILEQAPMDEDARQAAVRAAFDAAQARRGGLDGRWRLSAGDGRVLYIFQFSDPGQSPDPRSITPQAPVIEGAWRDRYATMDLPSEGAIAHEITETGDLAGGFGVSPCNDGGSTPRSKASIVFNNPATPEAGSR